MFCIVTLNRCANMLGFAVRVKSGGVMGKKKHWTPMNTDKRGKFFNRR
jgi:hypothetical protein